MAKLHKLGDYEGPGEKMTAERLAMMLPDNWIVIPGRKLPERREDLDLIVVGENVVFVIEEKHWGPTVVVGDQTWKVVKRDGRTDERVNPLNAAASKARKVAGWFKGSIPGYKSVGGFSVQGIVILSYENMDLRTRLNQLPIEVMELEESAALLEALDLEASKHTEGFPQYRDSVIQLLLDAETSTGEERQIGPYRVRAELSVEPGVRTFEGEHVESGDVVWLKAFELNHWEKLGKDSESLVNHELRVLQNEQLKDAARVWTYSQPFEFDRRNWYVVPMNKPRDAISIATLNSDDSRHFYKNSARSIIRDAFAALATLHEAGVVHRALTPERVWICKGLRVKFNDLNLSHVDGLETISNWDTSATVSPYADEDALRGIAFSTKESDVYALAFVLAEWLSGTPIMDKSGIVSFLQSQPQEKHYEVLLQALNDDPSPEQRPNAKQIVSLLQLSDKEPEAQLAPDSSNSAKPNSDPKSVAGFEVLEKLGSGAVGSTYRVSFDGDDCVLKVPHDIDKFKFIEREAEVAKALEHVEGVTSVIEKSKAPQPGFLLLSFAPGETLNKFSARPDFSISQARVIAKNALEVIGKVHESGYLHGDLSPRNIIVDEDLRVRLIDFGLGRQALERMDAPGTPLIAPPELLDKSRAEYTAVSELYSFAVAMVWSILNRSPYVGPENNLSARDSTVVELSPEEKAQWGDESSSFISALLSVCNPNPSARPQSAAEFIDLLHRTNERPVEELPSNLERKVNPFVDNLRGLYIQSSAGAPNSLGLGTEFAYQTYVPTRLDEKLLPEVLGKKAKIVFLTGNPGDGKTSFLQMLESKLKDSGALKQELGIGDDASGWKYKHESHTFLAIYDASEGWAGQSADEIVAQSLRAALDSDVTALLAINDGRLLQFFVEYEEEFPDLAEQVMEFFEGESTSLPGFVIVDLKTRGVVDANQSGLAATMLRELTDDSNWSICQQCRFETACPINRNRKALAGGSGDAVLSLLRISHLRRLKRRTLRQIRSTVGWLLTGDKSCSDVENIVLENRTDEFNLDRLIFEGPTEDNLIKEWRDLDPGTIIAPEMARFVGSRAEQAAITSRRDAYVDFMRRAFLKIDTAQGVSSDVWQKYRHLDVFSNALEGMGLVEFKRSILRGLSRLQGLAGYNDDGLAFQVTASKSNWGIVSVIPEEEFTLKIPKLDSKYVEAVADGVELTHSRGALEIHLDMAELILRASDGMVLGSTQNPDELSEISSFISKLRQAKASEIEIVRPSGAIARVYSKSGQITLTSGAE